jgi:carboxyl-terminal processing protease
MIARFAQLSFLTSFLCGCLSGLAQEDPWNLSFEQYNSRNQQFSPWYKTWYHKKQHRIAPDSTTRQHGRYSVRFQYAPDAPDKSDGQFVNVFALDVPCKKLKLTFYAKMEGTTPGGVGLLISQDKGEKKIESKMVSVRDTTWTLYTTELDMDKFTFPTDHIRITTGYSGEQSMWLDNLTLYADDKPVQEMTSFCKPINEKIQPLTVEQVTRLALLSQTWGFLKYYHPEVAKGSFNWDMELFRLIPVAKSPVSDAAFSDTLLNWINALGTIKACSGCTAEIPKDVLTYNIDLAWMKDKHLSPALQDKLQFLLANRHKEAGHYVKHEGAWNASFPNELEYKWRNSDYPNENFRLLTLFRYWNMIHYFYPYKYIIDKNWNEVLYSFIPRMAEAKDVLAYNTSVLQLIVSVKDSHANSYNRIVAKQYELYLPVTTYIYNDELVVTGLYNDSLAALAGLQKGDVIEKVNGRTVKELIEEKKALMTGSNYPATLRRMSYQNIIAGGTEPQVTITVRRNGQSSTRQVKRYAYDQFNYKYKMDSTYWKILPGNIGYVNMGILERAQVDSMMKLLKDTRSIIFDIRNYPRGTVPAISEYLLDKPVPFATVTYPQFDYPGAFKAGLSPLQSGPLSNKRKDFKYAGKIVILVNETSQSHAEWSTMGLQAVPGSYTIGSQTSGADGNSAMLYLPGGYSTYMTGLGIFYPDGSPTQQVGVRIDKKVIPTAAGIAAGKDEVLDAAITYINQQIKG